MSNDQFNSTNAAISADQDKLANQPHTADASTDSLPHTTAEYGRSVQSGQDDAKVHSQAVACTGRSIGLGALSRDQFSTLMIEMRQDFAMMMKTLEQPVDGVQGSSQHSQGLQKGGMPG